VGKRGYNENVIDHMAKHLTWWWWWWWWWCRWQM